MTNTSELRSVDSDRVDEGSRQWPRAVAALLIGLIIGALLGVGYGASRPSSYQASTALSVLPDPTIDITSQNSDQTSVPSLDATAYIQSQLVVINGDQLADEVRSALGLSARPDVTATQVGQTYVVQVVAANAEQSQAVAIAKSVGAQYRTLRTRQLTTEIDGLLTSTSQQLKAVRSSLSAQRSGTSNATALSPSQTALQTEYERLLSVRSSLSGTRSQVSKVVTVVSPARVSQSSVSTTTKDTLAGAVIGSILGLVVFLAIRRSVHRVRSVSDLAALDVPVLLPVQPRRSMRAIRQGAFWRTTQARLLAARLQAQGHDEHRPLVFVGTTPGVGASTMAASVAAALADTGPVLLVQLGRPKTAVRAPESSSRQDHVSGSPGSANLPTRSVVPSSISGVWLAAGLASADQNGLRPRRQIELIGQASSAGWLVVIDAAPVSESDIAALCARSGAAVVLVVGRGTSSPAAVLAAAELFEAHGTGTLGAVLNDTAGPLRRLITRQWPAMSPGVGSAGGRHTPAATIDNPPLTGDERSRPSPGLANRYAESGSDTDDLVQHDRSDDLPTAVVSSDDVHAVPAPLDDAPPADGWSGYRWSDETAADMGGDADLGDADLGDAGLGDAGLGDADLGDADLGDADLGDADLGDADLGDADLGDVVSVTDEPVAGFEDAASPGLDGAAPDTTEHVPDGGVDNGFAGPDAPDGERPSDEIPSDVPADWDDDRASVLESLGLADDDDGVDQDFDVRSDDDSGWSASRGVADDRLPDGSGAPDTAGDAFDDGGASAGQYARGEGREGRGDRFAGRWRR